MSASSEEEPPSSAGPSVPGAARDERARGDRHASFFQPREHSRGSSERPRAALEPGQHVGPFLLEEFIARGGMGEVWKARDETLRRSVALKLVLPDLVEQRTLDFFAREARAGGRLAHPNIVTTLANGTDDGLAWIAQELIEGSWTLKDFLDDLRAHDSVPSGYYPRVAQLVAQLADALGAAHAAGVIHRDVKPANVLIAPDDRPKLTDFGLARVSDESLLSMTGEVTGTYTYMSPEQVKGLGSAIDHRTDVFSLGIVLYELLTLRRPFEGDTAPQIAERIAALDPTEPSKVRSQCPRDLSIICGKALEKEPARRYQAMEEFAADLRRHLANETILARPASTITRASKWIRRHPVVSASTAIGLVAFGVVTWLLVVNVRVNDDLVAQTLLAKTNAERASAEALRAGLAESATTAQLNDVLSLSASRDLAELVARAQKLWPARAALLPEYEAWLRDAAALVDGSAGDAAAGKPYRPSLVQHQAKLAELRARGVLDETSGELVFASANEAWWNEQLTSLVSGLEALRDPLTGLAGDTLHPDFGWGIAKRYEFARTIEERTVAGPDVQRLWAEARAAIAVSPQYAGLELAPQIGLVPIGADPDSGLWEFAHVQTGDVPVRGPDGRLVESGSTGIVFVLIPGGEFWMGAQNAPGEQNHDPDAGADDGPVRRVMLSPYFVSKYEMTQGQWLAIHAANPSQHNQETYAPFWNRERREWSGRHPVEQISWLESRAALERLGLSLPTEAQWEHCARAGTSHVFCTGDELASLQGAANIADAYARANGGQDWDVEPTFDDGSTCHMEVGSYRANAFGLHDVHGNVWEWCLDGFDRSAHVDTPPIDPLVEPDTSPYRVLRGGSYIGTAALARVAYRSYGAPEFKVEALGLRPARHIER